MKLVLLSCFASLLAAQSPTMAPTFSPLDADSVTGTANGVYYGVYIAYFLGIIVLSLMLDRLGLMDERVAELGNKAHKAFMKYEIEKARGNAKKEAKARQASGLEDKSSGGGCCGGGSSAVVPIVDPEAELKKPHEIEVQGEVPVVNHKPGCCRRFWCGWDGGEDEYNPLFIKKILSPAAYYGCVDDMVCCLCCTSGMSADFIFFLLNRHSLLSMFCASKQNSFSRNERRVAYYVQHSLAFMCAVLVESSGMDPNTRIIFNVLVITPFTMFINTSYYYMLACPCLVREWKWDCCRRMADCLEVLGKVIAYPLSITSFFLLLVAATATTDWAAVAKYAYQVHLTSMLSEVALASFLFRYNTYTEYKFCGVKVFAFGTWFKEQCEIFDLKEGVHYNVSSGCFLIPCLMSQTQWKRVPGVVRPLPFDGDVELAQSQMDLLVPATAVGKEHTGGRQKRAASGADNAPEQEELIPGSVWVEAVDANSAAAKAMFDKIYQQNFAPESQPQAAPQPQQQENPAPEPQSAQPQPQPESVPVATEAPAPAATDDNDAAAIAV